MSYSKQTWADGAAGGTPIDAAHLSHIEDGVAAAYDRTNHTGTQAASTVTGLSTVATSGRYGDLSGTPVLATVATSGAWGDLTGRPNLSTVATSGSYTDLTSKPTLAPVATSGAYTDLTGAPTLAPVATSGSMSDLAGSLSIEQAPANTTITVVKDATNGWPSRPTARADIVVAWKGADPSPAIVSSGTGGMLSNVDYRLVIS